MGLESKKLNLGCGDMIKPEYLNFDCDSRWKRGGFGVDVVGKIEEVLDFFSENYFEEVLCSHVIEHFYKTDSLKMLRDIHTLLKPGGKAIIEGPDILGLYHLYVRTKNNVALLIEHLYPEKHRIKYGPQMRHLSGWTKDILASEMGAIGFKIYHIGMGMTHGMGNRDFRVVGIK